MRIPIHYAPSTVKQEAASNYPAPLVRLSPSGELVLVELQGSLEMDGCDPRGGETIGTISFPTGRDDKPVLQISHHRLEGSIVKLRRPLAVLEKQMHPRSPSTRGANNPSATATCESSAWPSSPPVSPPASPPTSLPASPSLSSTASRKRAAPEPCVTPPRRHPPTTLSSSPMPECTASWSDGYADFSSPNSQARQAKPLNTITSYTIVTLVRHKLLFSTRPEPIVNLPA
ncbi:hypothetical protein MGL_0109 [Malassezia globosa CBS 7966]|uniref:Uncharacterized protein n=1 Tax=Malassezia globosa (strain ATCC MYA-4612 / CBS 7966) TaxID=425265 RepID=A8PRR2_MALGO|nr:uncharacterized protein MGL_0109 [Malassezia globosa CBS 7966]EDP45120.1 hypothetical protein MGL_0109 [Malassezia globosa CBS 7966]